MDNEQMGSDMEARAPDDAFVAGMEDKPLAQADAREPAADPGGEETVPQDPVGEELPAELPPPGPAQAADTQEARTQRFQGVDEFARTFPQAYRQAREDPGSIPDSVWRAVSQGMSLTSAYAQHAVDQAAREARTAQQNHKNAQRSTGSMRSAGSDMGARDAFLSGFDM